MASAKPVEVLVVYRLKKGAEAEFRPLLARHWPTLDRLGLVTRDRPRIWKGQDKEGGVAYVEIFSWKDGQAAGVAHETPEVMQIWEPMGPLLENLELLDLEPAQL
jgi:hypothetical protein